MANTITGSDGPDQLTGADEQTNRIIAKDGDDTVSGAELADELFGGFGDDSLDGRAGNDEVS